MRKSIICAIVKNEQLFIREWIEWYLDKGFDKLYIYEDYGSTSHKDIISDYIEQDKVSLFHLDDGEMPIPKRGIRGGQSTQTHLYRWFLYQCKEGIIDADWVGFFDVDEFIEFEDGYNLWRLEDEYSNTPGVLLSWVMYGASGHIKRPDSVVKSYTQHLPLGTYIDGCPQWAVKSLVNVHNCEGMIHIHAFRGCVNTSGGDKDSPLSFKKAWINHYFTKSWEDYCDRIFNRGNMQNNFRCLDLFFTCSPEFEDRRKEMIEEQRYRHTASTMWISHKEKLISGGNVGKLMKIRLSDNGMK